MNNPFKKHILQQIRQQFPHKQKLEVGDHFQVKFTALDGKCYTVKAECIPGQTDGKPVELALSLFDQNGVQLQ